MILKTWQMQLLESIDKWDDFCLSQSDITNQKKQQLLEMARNGEPRPHYFQHALGKSLSRYTTGNAIDLEFKEQIYKLAPNWFVSKSEQKKQQLLDMARDGKPRPNKNHSLSQVFGFYTNSLNACYDFEFHTKIKKFRPDWFVKQIDIANQKKQQLLNMARNGKPRPSQSCELGCALSGYLKTDPEFSEKIQTIRADWFPSRLIRQKKQQLLEMARNGEPKPSYGNHSLGRSLAKYINSNDTMYDEKFKNHIMQLRLDWFTHPSDIADQKRQQLLEIARRGESKPNYEKHPLGGVLSSYVNPQSDCYNLKFDKQIRKLRPDWFIFRSNKANQKKQLLLEMAKNGEPKLHWKHSMYARFKRYTTFKSDCYDPEFDKEIRKLRPDWFRNI